jgi:hypothetical protein
MTVKLHDPTPAEAEPYVDRNGVRRSKDGRPYVKTPCPNSTTTGQPGEVCCIDGRIPGKRPGTTKQCPKCKGAGAKEVLYTRCTSFVGALEDRQGLERWMKRTVLVGLAADHKATTERNDREEVWQLDSSILDRVGYVDPDDREALDALADEAFTLGEGYEKAQKGTDLHALTEKVDRGEALSHEASLADRRDMAAWRRLYEEYGIENLDVERFVVVDSLKVAGTYDRRVVSSHEAFRCDVCEPNRGDGPLRQPKVLDLKTGRVDYGGGKMRQQLAVYAHGEAYDPETGRRSEHDVCPHVGFIVHLPAGSGEAYLYRTDLVQGWRDVQLSAQVREHRRSSRNSLELVSESP